MKKKAILILLFNKRPDKSSTILSMVENKEQLNSTTIVIWNNGPEAFNDNDINYLKDSFYKYDIIETIDNLSLSYIYNFFIKHYDSDHYIIYDDDSSISSKNLELFLSYDREGVGIPLAIHENILCSPTVKGEVNVGPFAKNEKLFAIGSGVIISKNIINILEQSYGDVFDERFAFYGVDSTLFLRMRQLGLVDQVNVVGEINHSLSGLIRESTEINHFRRKERSIDFALQVRFYSKNKFLLILKELSKRLIGNKKYSFRAVFFYYLKGKHFKAMNSHR